MEAAMKLRLVLSVCLMIALFIPGFAWAAGPAGSPPNYLALGDSLAFGYIEGWV